MQPEAPPSLGMPFDYDRERYDRRFMSCLYRHAVVWLKRRGVPADLLFYDALASSDYILQQIVVEKRPKFAFRCEAFSDDDFALIGVREVAIMADAFESVRPLIVDRLARGDAAFLEGNVFHLPHCPEYRSAHAQHVIVIDRLNGDGKWHIVDDDPASVLLEYIYETPFIAAFYENSVNRKLRFYEIDSSLIACDVERAVTRRFAGFVANHRDSFAFYDAVLPVLASPYDADAIKFRVLYDAFTLLSGSRACFSGYLLVSGQGNEIVAQARACSAMATTIKNMMARAKITGTFNAMRLEQHCIDLKKEETDLYHMLFDLPVLRLH